MGNLNMHQFITAKLPNSYVTEVFAFADASALSAFTSYCEERGVRYDHVNASGAMDVLSRRSGIGYGCYAIRSANDINADFRQMEAMRRLLSLSSYVGLVVMTEPIGLLSNRPILTSATAV